MCEQSHLTLAAVVTRLHWLLTHVARVEEPLLTLGVQRLINFLVELAETTIH